MAILCGDNGDIILKKKFIYAKKRHLICVIHTKYHDGVNKNDTP